MTSITQISSSSQLREKLNLSILIPYFQDDPTDLLEALLQQIQRQPQAGTIEVLLYDDGSNDDALNERVIARVKRAHSAVHLIINTRNKGRSTARNTLQNKARAEWVLFLDADMRPVTRSFLSDYMTLIKDDIADIIFGGFTVPAKADTPDQELHRAFSEVSDCLPLQARQAAGPQFVVSSNLCIRKSVINHERFDDSFVGWGWEDSEWAARAAKSHRLIHADIPTLHLGLQTTDTLLKRFQNIGLNYVRLHKNILILPKI